MNFLMKFYAVRLIFLVKPVPSYQVRFDHCMTLKAFIAYIDFIFIFYSISKLFALISFF